MARFLLQYLFLTALVVGGANLRRATAQSAAGAPPLSVEEVVKQWKNNVSEELMITMIKKNGRAFNLSSEEVQELRNVGLSDTVIKFLIDPSQPYIPPPAPPPPPSVSQPPPGRADTRTPPRQFPADGHAAQIPLDAGLYHLSDSVPLKTDVKLLLGEKQSAGVGKVLMKKAKAIGYLLEGNSKTRVKGAAPVFYLRLPEGKAIEEVVLVAFDQEKGRRRIEIGPSPDKQELKAETMRPFESLEVAPRLFKVTTAKLSRGEYMFLLLGSAEPSKGVYGKGYDFGIEGP